MAASASSTKLSVVKDMINTGISHKLSKRTKKQSVYKGDPTGGLFPVEKIIGERIVSGKVQFKVKWKGYSDAEDSWEPEENLDNVSDLIAEFRNRDLNISLKLRRRSRSSSKTKTSGRYEYVAPNELIAPKSKYFDDIRDGKIDLTKHDLYSRVKTRKRMNLELALDDAVVGQSCSVDNASLKRSRSSSVDDLSCMSSVEPMKTPTLSSTCSISPSCLPISHDVSTSEDAHAISMESAASPASVSGQGQALISSECSGTGSINCEQNNTKEKDDMPEKVNNTAKRVPSVHQTRFLSHRKKVQRVSPLSTLYSSFMKAEHRTPDRLRSPAVTSLSRTSHKRSSPPMPNVNLPCRPLVTSEKELIRAYTSQLGIPSASSDPWNPSHLPELQLESSSVNLVSSTELYQAISNNRWNLLEKALKSGQFDLGRAEFKGASLLMEAIRRDRVAMIRLLLRYGASPNGSDDATGKSALMLAAELSHLHAVKALLDHGAFTDFRNTAKQTAVHVAIQHGRLAVVELLLAHGSNFYAVDASHTAINLVSRLRNSGSSYVDSVSLNRIHDLIYDHHNKLTCAMQTTVNQYLTKLNLRHELVLLPCQWISVMEGRFEAELNLTTIVDLHTPLLLLVHGLQCGSSYHFWMDDGPCFVRCVTLNDKVQAALKENSFVTTLFPLCPCEQPTNRLVVEFHKPDLDQDKLIRVAVIAIDVQSMDVI